MITITFAGWMIPAAITLIGLIWALFIVDDDGGMFGGLTTMFALIPVLAVSLIAWVIYAILK